MRPPRALYYGGGGVYGVLVVWCLCVVVSGVEVSSANVTYPTTTITTESTQNTHTDTAATPTTTVGATSTTDAAPATPTTTAVIPEGDGRAKGQDQWLLAEKKTNICKSDSGMHHS